MSRKALFEGLVLNEAGQVAGVALVGDEAFYVIDDNGFRRHVEAEKIDRQVLMVMREQILSNKDIVTESALQMIGKDDLFTKAMIDSSLKNIDAHLDQLMQVGFPEGTRQWIGMLGFRIVVNHHGELVELDQPGMPDFDGD